MLLWQASILIKLFEKPVKLSKIGCSQFTVRRRKHIILIIVKVDIFIL